MAHVIRRVAAAPPPDAVPEIVEASETTRVDARHLQDLIKDAAPAPSDDLEISVSSEPAPQARSVSRLAHTVRRTPIEVPPPPVIVANGSKIEIPVAEATPELLAGPVAAQTAVMPAQVADELAATTEVVEKRGRGTMIVAACAVLISGAACVLALLEYV